MYMRFNANVVNAHAVNAYVVNVLVVNVVKVISFERTVNAVWQSIKSHIYLTETTSKL